MPCCASCKKDFPNRVVIDGKSRNFSGRKYCLDCSPFEPLGYKRANHPVWSNKETIAIAIKDAKTIKEVLKRLGKKPYEGNYNTLKGVCHKFNLILPVFDRQENAKQTCLRIRKSDEQIFCKTLRRQNSTSLKKRMLEVGIEYKCQACGLQGFWQQKPLTLQVDHIDGDCCNNLLINLRFLCPNCHAQTKTFAGNKIIRKCICGRTFSKKATKCLKCSNKEKNVEKINFPDIEEIATLFTELKNFVKVAAKIGCSDNGLRLFLKRKGIVPNEFKKKYGGYSRVVQTAVCGTVHAGSNPVILPEKVISLEA